MGFNVLKLYFPVGQNASVFWDKAFSDMIKLRWGH